MRVQEVFDSHRVVSVVSPVLSVFAHMGAPIHFVGCVIVGMDHEKVGHSG